MNDLNTARANASSAVLELMFRRDFQHLRELMYHIEDYLDDMDKEVEIVPERA